MSTKMDECMKRASWGRGDMCGLVCGPYHTSNQESAQEHPGGTCSRERAWELRVYPGSGGKLTTKVSIVKGNMQFARWRASLRKLWGTTTRTRKKSNVRVRSKLGDKGRLGLALWEKSRTANSTNTGQKQEEEPRRTNG